MVCVCSWGIPRASDVGSIAVKVMERRSYPSPATPTRHSVSSLHSNKTRDEIEQLVGRFVLDVTDRK